ncbi:monovalent cation/H(+) antiporter subunit G [Puniceicoccaceae bacterium K14]|nr:monovalent cation/H(+) antiporter subunit G [Puniceicoccaceae bacterium K14]
MEYIIAFLIIAGSFFTAVAALGTLRLPDALSRTHAATKAGSFGATLLLIAAILFFNQLIVFIECLLIIAFFYTTTPIAGHLLGRVASKQNPSSKH